MRRAINMVVMIIAVGLVIGIGLGIGLTLAEYCRPDALWLYRDVLGFDIGSGCR